MSCPNSIDWRRLGRCLLRNALDRTAWLLLTSSKLERTCGEKLQELSLRLRAKEP